VSPYIIAVIPLNIYNTSSQDIGDLIYSIIELIAIKNGTDRGQKSRVINRSILQNDVIYYFGG